VGLDKDCWLPLGDFTGDIHAAEPIDQWIEPTLPFWATLETECVAECCGIEALRFWPGDVIRAQASHLELAVASQLRDFRQHVLISSSSYFKSLRLNQTFPREFLVRLLDHLVYYLDSPH